MTCQRPFWPFYPIFPHICGWACFSIFGSFNNYKENILTFFDHLPKGQLISEWLFFCRRIQKFSMGWDSATFGDKQTEVPSLSRDKGTMGQAKSLATGRYGLGKAVKIWDRKRDGTRDGTITNFFTFFSENQMQIDLPTYLKIWRHKWMLPN